MVQKEITGRLGNQMFQYAALRAYMERFKDYNLILSFKHVYNKKFPNDLKELNICSYEEKSKLSLSIKQKLYVFFIKLIEKIIKIINFNNREKYIIKCNKFQKKIKKNLMKNGIYFIRYDYIDFEPSACKNKIFIGWFESPKYFENIKEILIKEFTPKKSRLKKNKDLYYAIENSESICVSIRRGDFLNKKNIKRHYVCNEIYFEKAMERITKEVKNPKFFIFSDDINWVKDNMIFPDGSVFEDGKDPFWEKLRLMYTCKHFIISNSTFSWWAQYLSTSKNKVVIAPTRWKNEYYNKDIIQDNWILISPD